MDRLGAGEAGGGLAGKTDGLLGRLFSSCSSSLPGPLPSLFLYRPLLSPPPLHPAEQAGSRDQQVPVCDRVDAAAGEEPGGEAPAAYPGYCYCCCYCTGFCRFTISHLFLFFAGGRLNPKSLAGVGQVEVAAPPPFPLPLPPPPCRPRARGAPSLTSSCRLTLRARSAHSRSGPPCSSARSRPVSRLPLTP